MCLDSLLLFLVIGAVVSIARGVRFKGDVFENILVTDLLLSWVSWQVIFPTATEMLRNDLDLYVFCISL